MDACHIARSEVTYFTDVVDVYQHSAADQYLVIIAADLY